MHRAEELKKDLNDLASSSKIISHRSDSGDWSSSEDEAEPIDQNEEGSLQNTHQSRLVVPLYLHLICFCALQVLRERKTQVSMNIDGCTMTSFEWWRRWDPLALTMVKMQKWMMVPKRVNQRQQSHKTLQVLQMRYLQEGHLLSSSSWWPHCHTMVLFLDFIQLSISKKLRTSYCIFTQKKKKYR